MGGKSKTMVKSSLILLLSLSFALAGCGGNNNNNTAAKEEESKGAAATPAESTDGKIEPFNVSVFIG